MEKDGYKLTKHDGAIFPIPERGLTIGRSRGNDLVISDAGVSRLHARIFYSGGACWLRDENSASGVLVNDSRVRGQQELRLGDVVHIGSTALRVDPIDPASLKETSSAKTKQLPILLAVAGALLIVFIIIATSGKSPGNVPVSSGNTTSSISSSTAAPTQAPVQAATSSSGDNYVSSRRDAQGAVIQIESIGNFADFETGEIMDGVHGSGFIIDPEGIAVTNNHVVSGATSISVWVGGDQSRQYSARILGTSECFDLAIIDIEGSGFDYLTWYQDPIVLELPVYAAGYPLGEPQYTITSGAISRENSSGDTPNSSIPYSLMHTADITSGNSGGPLLSEDGRVVGVNYAGRIYDNQYFAISSAVAIPVINELKSGQDDVGIGINAEAFVAEIDGELISGLWISSVELGSKASQVGLINGDIIVGMLDSEIGIDGTLADYCKLIYSVDLNSDVIPILVLRLTTEQILYGEINGDRLVEVQD